MTLDDIERELTYLKGISALLHWDRSTQMPAQAIAQRSQQMSYVALKSHALLTDPKTHRILKKTILDGKGIMKARAERLLKDVERSRKLPASHVKVMSETISHAEHAWEIAKERNDYAFFKPHLKRIVELKRQEARYIDPNEHPYTVLMQEFEEGMSERIIQERFAALRDDLRPLLLAVLTRPQPKGLPKKRYLREAQDALARKAAYEIMGENRTVIQQSVHPFTTTISPDDVRITIAYRDNPFFSFHSAIHEAGHALYELSFDPRYRATSLFDAASYGLHESQSRYWENNISLSYPFWKRWARIYNEAYGTRLDAKAYYHASNIVTPGPIRIEADELTYPFHIIIRFECERALIEGTLSVDDLPAVWNAKYKEYLDVAIKDDAHGVLQDVHWSSGAIGYFPSYLIGTIYASMIHEKLDSPAYRAAISKGDYRAIKEWLATSIQRHGRRYSAETIMKRATGKGLDHHAFMRYLTDKYRDIYRI